METLALLFVVVLILMLRWSARPGDISDVRAEIAIPHNAP